MARSTESGRGLRDWLEHVRFRYQYNTVGSDGVTAIPLIITARACDIADYELTRRPEFGGTAPFTRFDLRFD